jgi:hypothetical protein
MTDDNVLLDVTDTERTAADMALAKQVAEGLLKHYPGYLWAVNVRDGVISVKNLNLSGTWGFIIKLGTVFSYTDLEKRVRTAGGEILERYRVSRERMSAERANDKLVVMPTNFAGQMPFDK